jgi:hypothetical protein
MEEELRVVAPNGCAGISNVEFAPTARHLLVSASHSSGHRACV